MKRPEGLLEKMLEPINGWVTLWHPLGPQDATWKNQKHQSGRSAGVKLLEIYWFADSAAASVSP